MTSQTVGAQALFRAKPCDARARATVMCRVRAQDRRGEHTWGPHPKYDMWGAVQFMWNISALAECKSGRVAVDRTYSVETVKPKTSLNNKNNAKGVPSQSSLSLHYSLARPACASGSVCLSLNSFLLNHIKSATLFTKLWLILWSIKQM